VEFVGVVWTRIISDEVRNIFLMAGVVIALLSLRNTIQLAKKKQSSDLVFAGRNDDDFKCGVAALNRRAATGTVRELAFTRNHDEADATNISYVLNYFEAIGIGISQGIYDEAILKSNYRRTVVGLWNCATVYVMELRRVKNNGAIYLNLQRMAERWALPDSNRGLLGSFFVR